MAFTTISPAWPPIPGAGAAVDSPAAEDGALLWENDATTPGSVKINGTEMMGGP